MCGWLFGAVLIWFVVACLSLVGCAGFDTLRCGLGLMVVVAPVGGGFGCSRVLWFRLLVVSFVCLDY